MLPLPPAPPALVEVCFLPPLVFPILIFSPAWTRWRKAMGELPEMSQGWPQVVYSLDLDPQERMEVI